MSEIAHSVFVVIAENMGTNVGFKGANISIPCEILTGKKFSSVVLRKHLGSSSSSTRYYP